MNPKQILVVDDETAISDAVSYYLTREGHYVEASANGRDALSKLAQKNYDLIVLDLMLPDVNGLEITRLLKKESRTSNIPIILLTAKSEEVDVVIGFELDVADYITKPFSARILTARINSILRQKNARVAPEPDAKERLTVKDLAIIVKSHEVFVMNHKVELTKSEFELLLLLMKHPGWVYSRSQIVDELKGSDYPVTDRSVDSQIMNLRKKLGEYGQYIETVRGVGYKFIEDNL